MNEPELTVVLDYFGTAYSKVIEPEVFQVWWELLSGVDGDVALAAAHLVAAREEFFPTVAVFNKFVAEVLRERRRREVEINPLGPRRDCPTCGGDGWYEVEPIEHYDEVTGKTRYEDQWKPCARCEPAAHHRFEQHNTDRIRSKPPRPEDLLAGATPAEVFAEARAALDPDGDR